MGKSKEEFEMAISNLKSSKSEEEVFGYLVFIAKGFSVSLYKDIVLENPYYKDIFIDVKKEVLLDLESIKENIKEEISSIEEEMRKQSAPIELKALKGDCVSLIYEVERKILEIESIFYK